MLSSAEFRMVTDYLTLSLTSTSAPPSRSSLLISTWPSLQVMCKAVQPLVCMHTMSSDHMIHTCKQRPTLSVMFGLALLSNSD